MDFVEAGAAEGEGAGLVEADGADAGEGLDGLAALEEDAALGGAGDRRERGGGRGDDQGAGRGDDEQGDGGEGGLRPGEVEGEAPQEEDQHAQRHHGDGVGLAEPVDGALHGLALLAGAGDEVEDLLEAALGDGAEDGGLDGVVGVDGAREELIADADFAGHGLAGDGGLVDLAFALQDACIGGDALAGADADALAGGQGVGTGLDPGGVARVVGAEHEGLDGHELVQGLDLALRALHREFLERAGEGEEEEQQRALFGVADRRGEPGADDHEHVDVHALLAQGQERSAAAVDHADGQAGPDERFARGVPGDHVQEKAQQQQGACEERAAEFAPGCEECGKGRAHRRSLGCRGRGALWGIRGVGEHDLPPVGVVPALELAADLAEGADVAEAHGAVQGDGGVVGQRDAADGGVEARGPQSAEQFGVEGAADAAAMEGGHDVD